VPNRPLRLAAVMLAAVPALGCYDSTAPGASLRTVAGSWVLESSFAVSLNRLDTLGMPAPRFAIAFERDGGYVVTEESGAVESGTVTMVADTMHFEPAGRSPFRLGWSLDDGRLLLGQRIMTDLDFFDEDTDPVPADFYFSLVRGTVTPD
jgi:hypothetical protein